MVQWKMGVSSIVYVSTEPWLWEKSYFWMMIFWMILLDLPLSGTPKQKDGWSCEMSDFKEKWHKSQVNSKRELVRSFVVTSSIQEYIGHGFKLSFSRVLLQSLNIFNAHQSHQTLKQLCSKLVLSLAFWLKPYEHSFWPSLAQIFVVLYVALPEEAEPIPVKTASLESGRHAAAVVPDLLELLIVLVDTVTYGHW